MKTPHLVALALALLIGRANAADTPSYTKDVKPFIAKYCAECHGGNETKAGVNLLSVEAMQKSGKKGKALVPENPEKSKLYQSMVGGGKRMPPKKFGKKPTNDEIAMIKAWIVAGAKDDTMKDTPEKKETPATKEETAATRRDAYDPHGAADE